jgi:hypothetical protein
MYIVQCHIEEACLGGEGERGSGDTCAPKYTGRRCGLCAEGHYLFGQACYSCGGYEAALLTATLVLVLPVLFSIWVLVGLLDPYGSEPLLFVMRFVEVMVVLRDTRFQWPVPVKITMETMAFINMDPALFRLECFMGASDPIGSMLSPFYAVLCLLLFLLGLAVIVFNFPTQPEELREMVSEYLSLFQRYRRCDVGWLPRHPGKPKVWQLYLCLDFRDKMLVLLTVRNECAP